jgi:[protein-PII] uridylyltransferase
MQFADRPGRSAVERFMHFYFLNAKTVGDVTGLFLAHLDEAMAKKGRRFYSCQMQKYTKCNFFQWAEDGGGDGI